VGLDIWNENCTDRQENDTNRDASLLMTHSLKPDETAWAQLGSDRHCQQDEISLEAAHHT